MVLLFVCVPGHMQGCVLWMRFMEIIYVTRSPAGVWPVEVYLAPCIVEDS